MVMYLGGQLFCCCCPSHSKPRRRRRGRRVYVFVPSILAPVCTTPSGVHFSDESDGVKVTREPVRRQEWDAHVVCIHTHILQHVFGHA